MSTQVANNKGKQARAKEALEKDGQVRVISGSFFVRVFIKETTNA